MRAALLARRPRTVPLVDEQLRRAERRAAGDVLRQALDEHRPQVVLSDVFDTLLVRSVHPEDVKRLAARDLAQRLDLRTSPQELYRLRAEHELALCRRAAGQGSDDEFRFEELAGELRARLSPSEPAVADLDDTAWAELLLDVELAVERGVQDLDGDVADVLREHTAAGGRLQLVSDFYLPAEALTRLLEAVGLPPEHYERLVVSSASLLTKRSGRLYDRLLPELGVPASAVLMVGDNAHSDGEMARSRGLRAVVLPRDRQREHYLALAARCTSRPALAAAVDEVLRQDPAGPDGEPDVFPELALTLAHCTVRLHERLRREGASRVHFLAREGRLLQHLLEVYDRLLPVPAGSSLTCSYAYVSRRSTFLPSLGPLDEEDFHSLFRQYRALSVREFLFNLGFGPDEAAELAHAAGVPADVVEDDLPTSAVFAALRGSPAFRNAYEARRDEQTALLREYLHVDEAPLALVDVGWKGTIQDHLARALQPRGGTSGYYLGLVAPGAERPDDRKDGLLFDFRRAEGRFYEVFDENRALFEVALTAPHGSTAGYRRGQDGAVEPVLEPMTAAEELVAARVRPLQSRLVARAERILALLAPAVVDDDWLLGLVARRHARMVLFPRRDELAWFSRLSHEENFGLFRPSRFGGTEPLTPRARVRHAVTFARAPRAALVPSFWPRLGLSQMGLGPVGLLYGTYKARRLWPASGGRAS